LSREVDECKPLVHGAGPSLSADFTFVARDPVTNASAAVNPLVPHTAAAAALFERTATRVDLKKRRMKAGAYTRPLLTSR
jgi:hypothetical protein